MGFTQLLDVIRALPPERQSEVFDFVEFLAARYGTGQQSSSTDWAEAVFSELALVHAQRGTEDEEPICCPDDNKKPWQ
jgi:hypothetical protein